MEFRYAESDTDVLLVYALIIRAGADVAVCEFDPEKAFTWVWEAVKSGCVYMALDDDRCIGSVALIAITPGYSQQRFLTNQWFYVLPEYRGDIVLARRLLEEARAISEAAQMPLILTPSHSSPKPNRAGIYALAAVLRYEPVGAQTVLRRGSDHGRRIRGLDEHDAEHGRRVEQVGPAGREGNLEASAGAI